LKVYKKKKQGTNKKNYTKFEKSKNKKPKLKDIIEEKKNLTKWLRIKITQLKY